MSLHDRDVRRYFATGIAGLSVVADSLSAIKYAKVEPIRDESGIIVDFKTTGDFPKYGNDDDSGYHCKRTGFQFHDHGQKTSYLQGWFPHHLRTYHYLQRGLRKGNGATPDGRKAGEPCPEPIPCMEGTATEP